LIEQEKNMKIFIVTGMPASGKNLAASFAREHRYPYFSTGDIVRAEITRRGLKADPETSARISTEMREDDGLGVTKRAVKEALRQSADAVFIEGIRSWAEVEWIRSQTPCSVIAVVAPRDIRLERVKQRGREDDSADHFSLRDSREIDYGVAVCIALADGYVVNAGALEDAKRQLAAIVLGQ